MIHHNASQNLLSLFVLNGRMSRRPAWYDPEIEKSRLLASLDQTRRLCTRAETVKTVSCDWLVEIAKC